MSRPPRLAEWLVAVSTPARDRQSVLGDLFEEFVARAAGAGPRAARRWYWQQAAASFVPNVRRLISRDPFALPGHGANDHRDAFQRKGLGMSTLLQDFRFGWRMVQRRPLLTGIAILSLVVGMSAATIVFSLLNAVLFRPLAVADPDRLAVVLEQRTDGMNHNFSYRDFTDFRRAQQAFTDLAAYYRVQATLGHLNAAEVIPGELVSGSYFATLGIGIQLGRGLSDLDDRAEAPPAVVVSESLWRRLAGATGALDGRAVWLNGQPYTVVGVTAPAFRGMEVGRDARFWAPLRHQRTLSPEGGTDRLVATGANWLTLIGRLKPGVNSGSAAQDLTRIESGLPRLSNRPQPRTFTLVPGRQGDSFLPEAVVSPLQLLLAAAGLVLLVATTNVAGLLLGRASERERELALRTALGASKRRLARLLLCEAALLGVASTIVALVATSLLARLAVPLLARFGGPVTLDVSPDWRVLAFAALAGLGATVLFGLAPIVALLRRSLSPGLADSGRSASAGRRATWLRRGLVVVQFALSLALVLVAALLVRTLSNLRENPTGFDIDHVAVLEVDPEAAQYTTARMTQYLEGAIARLGAMPGVRAVGFARVIPLDFGGSRTTIVVPGYHASADEDMEINFNVVSPGYFDAMGMNAADGRVFDTSDVQGASATAVVNDTMARRYWPGVRAVGRQFNLSRDDAVTVVGVVPDVKYRMLREDATPSFYLASAQNRPRAGAFHVRTAGPPLAMIDVLRRALVEIDPAVPITRARSLREQADVNVSDERLAMSIAAGLAGAALLLAAVGLYGAMSYSVSQRTREIGVRLALGAVPSDVRALVLRQGLWLAMVGSVFGAGLGLLLARTIRARLFGVGPADAVSLLLSVAMLAGVALVASSVPARRASRVNPIDALRSE